MTHHRRKNTKRSDYCQRSGKRRFRDPKQATASLQHLQNLARELEARGTSHTIHVVRKYRCEACKGWHLTSWETPGGPQSTSVDALVANLAKSTGLGDRESYARAA